MKTFLPPNKFYSAVDIPADEAGASSSAPTPDAPADLSSSCEGDVRVGANGANSLHRPEASGVTPRSQEKAAIDSCQEPVAADLIQSSCGGTEVRRAKTGNMPGLVPGEEISSSATSFERVTVRGAAIQPCAGVTTSSQEATDCIGLLFYHARRLALPRFAPDYEAIWNAMHDPNAPRMLAGDPVWADASPLFLRDA